jgi:GNAT superfamily N-acetyltransferase
MIYSIQQATTSDAAIIGKHRVAMFQDMGEVPTDSLAAELLSTSIAALTALFREGSYVGWLAIDTGERVIAGAGAHVRPQLPRISHDGARVAVRPVALVLNVYTEPAWRGKGIARALMQRLMQWATSEGIDRVVLHASNAGRPLYQSLGFIPTNEMRWFPTQLSGDSGPSGTLAAG